jgi:cupin 2 domain-containing protein
MSVANLFADIPPNLPTELIQTLAESPNVRIERIISQGHASPPGFWYDQDHNEWVLVLTGEARVTFQDGSIVELVPGEFLNIPAHTRHRVEWTDPNQSTIWLAVHY